MNFLRNFKHAKRLFKNKQCNVLRQSTALVSVKAFPHTKMPVSGFEGNLTNLMKRKKNKNIFCCKKFENFFMNDVVFKVDRESF